MAGEQPMTQAVSTCRKRMRGGSIQSEACSTIPTILAMSNRGMTLPQIITSLNGTVAKRAVQLALQRFIENGVVVKEPYWRDMRTPMYRVKKEGE